MSNETYFDYRFNGEIVERGFWFHNMPLPDGKRTAGANHDRNREQKLWEAFRRLGINFKGKKVLDVGANDGYFSIAAALSGADVTSVNPAEICIGKFPERLNIAKSEWGVDLNVVVGDLMEVAGQFDVIMYFGVLYHAEDVLGHFRKMSQLLTPGGKVLIETPLTRIQLDRPILEFASDINSRQPTIYRGQQYVKSLGVGSFFIPNFMALQEMAWTWEMEITQLPDDNIYTKDLKDRKLFVMQKR